MDSQIPKVGSFSWISLPSSSPVGPEMRQPLFLLPVLLSGKDGGSPTPYYSTPAHQLPAFPSLGVHQGNSAWFSINSLKGQLNQPLLPRPQGPLTSSIDLDSWSSGWTNRQTPWGLCCSWGPCWWAWSQRFRWGLWEPRGLYWDGPSGSLSQLWPLTMTFWHRRLEVLFGKMRQAHKAQVEERENRQTGGYEDVACISGGEGNWGDNRRSKDEARPLEEISAFQGCEKKLGTSMGREQAMTFWKNSLSSSLPHRLHLGRAPRSISSQRVSTQWVSSLGPPPERASDRDESWGGVQIVSLWPLE